MKNILYDLTSTQPIGKNKFHGGGDYAEVVFLKILEKLDGQNIRLFAAYDSKKYINKLLLEKAQEKNVEILDINQEKPSEMLQNHKIDRFYSPLIKPSLGWNLDFCEVILTIHGLRDLEKPFDIVKKNYCSTFKDKKNFLRDFAKTLFFEDKFESNLIKGSSVNKFIKPNVKIVTVSNHSKYSLLSFFPELKADDINVFYSPTFTQVEKNVETGDFSKIETKYEIEGKRFFLATNADRWIKNVMRAVKAFDSLIDENHYQNFKLVLTGVTNKKIFEKNIHNKNNFVLLDYVERNELDSLYKNAFAFIYPSLNEGFGYPPVQAMKYEVPVAASGVTSIPEVCGDAVLYFDPYSVYEIKNRILQLSGKKIYDFYAEKGFKRYCEINKKQSEDLEKLVDFILN